MIVDIQAGTLITGASDTIQYILNYDQFFIDMFNELTGRISSLEVVGYQNMPDGSKIPQYQQVANVNPNSIKYMNDKGARYLVHHLQLQYNKYSALGDLTHDQIVNKVASVIDSTFSHLVVNEVEYALTDRTLLLAEAKSIMEGMHSYMTGSMHNSGGGITETIRTTLSIKENPNGSSGTEERNASTISKVNRALRGK